MNRCKAHLTQPGCHRRTTTKTIAARAVNAWTTGWFSIFLLSSNLVFSNAHAQQDSGVVLTAPDSVIADPSKGRFFPANALRGTLEVVQGADIILDGKAARLSPGARIRGPNNMLVMSAAMAGQPYVVNFTRDTYGNIHQVWVLTELEARQKIKTNTPERNFVFGFESDKPKVDDGKTPFNQLPKYKQ